MNRDQYRKLTRSPLRDVVQAMIADADRLPTRSELRAQLEQALPGDDDGTIRLRAAVFARCVELAAKAQDRQARFQLRGAADDFVLEVIEGLEQAERLVEPREEEVLDLDADTLDRLADTPQIGGDLNRQMKRDTDERVNALERARQNVA